MPDTYGCPGWAIDHWCHRARYIHIWAVGGSPSDHLGHSARADQLDAGTIYNLCAERGGIPRAFAKAIGPVIIKSLGSEPMVPHFTLGLSASLYLGRVTSGLLAHADRPCNPRAPYIDKGLRNTHLLKIGSKNLSDRPDRNPY